MIVNKSIKFSYFVCNKNIFRLKYEWVQPEGYNTGIKIYNPFLKTKVPLIFPSKHSVKWYICGPTVYDVSHIGHASCYIRFDIIRRTLEEYFDIKPIIALGVTDVAENINQKACKLQMESSKVALFYEKEFFKQMKALNILPPHIKLNVSQHLNTIRDFIEVLKKKELACSRKGDIVFKIMSDKNYGRFQSLEARKTSQDLEFALWRQKQPGWHVECSAMASHVFGSSIDIHSGGADLMFPHHENEESLSTCYHDCYQWVNYWIHSGLINLGDEKMSKSLGNLISVHDFLDKNSNDDLRMLCMMNPYRSNLSYDKEKISASAKLCEKIQKFLYISEMYTLGCWSKGNVQEAVLLKDIEETKCRIMENLKDDFGTEKALKEIVILIKKTMKMLGDESSSTVRSNFAMLSINAFVKNFFKSFGFSFAERKSESTTVVESIIETAVNFRSSIRSKALNRECFKVPLRLCDNVRTDFEKVGVKLSDFTDGSYWIRVNEGVDNKNLLNYIINSVVKFRGELLNFLDDFSGVDSKVLREECRSLKLYFSTLGIILLDEKGQYTWSFPSPDNSNATKFSLIIKHTLKFLKRVEEIARSLNNENAEKSKEELLSIHEAALLNLESFGIIVDKDGMTKWEMDDNNIKGESILQNVVDIFVHSFDSVETLKYVCTEDRSESLAFINLWSQKSLKLNGIDVNKEIPSLLTTLKLIGKTNNKELLLVMITETIKHIVRLKKSVKYEDDLVFKNAVLKIHDSVIADLEKIGVTVIDTTGSHSWKFKAFSLFGK